ncbi:MAG: hypothetical protein ACLQB1_11515 [Streptosporangiaceae bacterium]
MRPAPLLTVDGPDLHVTGLDAIGSSPVCDLARYFRDMGHAARYSQPAWSARTCERHKIL